MRLLYRMLHLGAAATVAAESAIPATNKAPATGDMMPYATDDAREDTGLECCYPHTLGALDDKFTHEYFNSQRQLSLPGAPSLQWSGHEEKEWETIRRMFEEYDSQESHKCAAMWKYTVLSEVNGFYLRTQFNHILTSGVANDNESFRFVPHSTGGAPRILMLGDSISRGVWTHLQNLVSERNDLSVHVQGAPTNCGGFEAYRRSLSRWLGDCEWDLVQFNVGAHFRSENMTEYANEIVNVVQRIRNHSPSAHVVFALTTPSPFDSVKTWPEDNLCKNYHLFPKGGRVPQLNAVASAALSDLNVTINDRFSVVHPGVLEQYQIPCDIHFFYHGYKLLAAHDLEVFSNLLKLDITS